MNQRYCNGMVHVIKQGENLYQLSRMYRVPLALILRANPYVDVYNLQIGQEICIPVARPFPGIMPPERPHGMPPQPPMPEKRNENVICPTCEDRREEDDREDRIEEREEQQEEETHMVTCDGRMSLGEILRMEEISLEELLKMNEIDHIILAADVQLQLPKKV